MRVWLIFSFLFDVRIGIRIFLVVFAINDTQSGENYILSGENISFSYFSNFPDDVCFMLFNKCATVCICSISINIVIIHNELTDR